MPYRAAKGLILWEIFRQVLATALVPAMDVSGNMHAAPSQHTSVDWIINYVNQVVHASETEYHAHIKSERHPFFGGAE